MTNVAFAEVQMTDFRLVHLTCTLNHELIEEDETGPPVTPAHYDFTFEATTPALEWPVLIVMMSIRFSKTSNVFPFERLEVVAVGHFFLIGEPADRQSFLRDYAIPSAKNMLYGSLRGLLTPLTSRFIKGERFIMPSIHNSSLLERANDGSEASPDGSEE